MVSAFTLGQLTPILASLLNRAPYLPPSSVAVLAEEAVKAAGSSDGDLAAWGQLAHAELERWRNVWTTWPLAPQPIEKPTGFPGQPLPNAVLAPLFLGLGLLGSSAEVYGPRVLSVAGDAVLKVIWSGDPAKVGAIVTALGNWLSAMGFSVPQIRVTGEECGEC